MRKARQPLAIIPEGKPSVDVRKRCIQSFLDRIGVLETIADKEDGSSADRLRAMDMLGKYGGLQHVDQTPEDEIDANRIVIDFGNMTIEERRQLARDLA